MISLYLHPLNPSALPLIEATSNVTSAAAAAALLLSMSMKLPLQPNNLSHSHETRNSTAKHTCLQQQPCWSQSPGAAWPEGWHLTHRRAASSHPSVPCHVRKARRRATAPVDCTTPSQPTATGPCEHTGTPPAFACIPKEWFGVIPPRAHTRAHSAPHVHALTPPMELSPAPFQTGEHSVRM